ncbi:ATP-binding protein [Liberiplasma polymorphum]|uniref:ATP-binding protein n=1 Tax=Liberiplasma polymorphum TaxID=3374570 RepID=UPI003772B0DF
MKRITILTGHYGSGKSEIAVNLAIQNRLNYLVDLDIINPYFRSRSVRGLLEKNDVTLIESTIENASGSDLPFISAKGSRPFVNKHLSAVFDLGGTQHGAKVMMQFRDFIKNQDEIDYLVVINVFRPETMNETQIIEMIETLEATSQLKVTGFINNSNLMDDTDEAMIKKGERVLKKVSKALNLPIVYTFVEEHVKSEAKFAGENRTLIRYLAQHWL